MGEYQLSPLAAADIDRIFDYTYDEWGLEQARRYSLLLQKALNELVEDPERPRSKHREDLTEGCLSYPVEHHVIFYRINDGLIGVGRVLHEAMRFETHVSEDVF